MSLAANQGGASLLKLDFGFGSNAKIGEKKGGENLQTSLRLYPSGCLAEGARPARFAKWFSGLAAPW